MVDLCLRAKGQCKQLFQTVNSRPALHRSSPHDLQIVQVVSTTCFSCEYIQVVSTRPAIVQVVNTRPANCTGRQHTTCNCTGRQHTTCFSCEYIQLVRTRAAPLRGAHIRFQLPRTWLPACMVVVNLSSAQVVKTRPAIVTSMYGERDPNCFRACGIVGACAEGCMGRRHHRAPRYGSPNSTRSGYLAKRLRRRGPSCPCFFGKNADTRWMGSASKRS
jgi:hypothetical protein